MLDLSLEKKFGLFCMIGLDSYILYLSISLFRKIKNKTETISELDIIRKIIYIVLGISVLEIGMSFFTLLKSKKRESITKFIINLIDLILTVTYVIILENLEDFYKAKNYDKSTKYAKILIGLDAGSILTSLVTVLTY